MNDVTEIDIIVVEDPCELSRTTEDDIVLMAVPLMLPIMIGPKLDGVEEVIPLEPLRVESEPLVVCAGDDLAVVVLRNGVTVMLDLRLVEVLKKRMVLVDSNVIAEALELDVCPLLEDTANMVDDTSVSVVVVVTRELDEPLLLLLLFPEAAVEEEEEANGTCCEIRLLLVNSAVMEEILLVKGSIIREELVIEGATASAELAPGVREIMIVWVSVGMTVTVLS